MNLFFQPSISEQVNDNKSFTADLVYTLSPDESYHAIKVLRLRVGEPILITNGKGTIFNGTITNIASATECQYTINEIYEQQLSPKLHLAAAPTKSTDRWEWMVEKVVEIGVSHLTPLLCRHSERKLLKTDRSERIINSAVKQSLKAFSPTLDLMTPFREFVESYNNSDCQKFIAHCNTNFQRELLKNCINTSHSSVILIGPEGDFSPEEIELATNNGFKGVSLGDSRLRAETASVYAAVIASL